jgi:hypothetical protein
MEQRKNVVLVLAVIIVMIGISIILAEQFSVADSSRETPGTDGASIPALPVTAISVSTMAVATGTMTKTPDVTISRQQAQALLDEWEMDEGVIHGYFVAGVSLTDRYPGKILYEFSLVPDNTSIRETNATLFIDAETGDPYNPLQDKAGITIEQAKAKARGAFPELSADRVRIRFNDGSQYMRSWAFELMKGEEKLVEGGLDADTGELSSYFIGITRLDRPETPSVTMDAAQQTADREIRERNGDISIVLVDARLDPLGMPGEKIAGQYVFVYNRIIRGVPCDSDGFTITVDSVAGNVVNYHKSWSLPEDAVALPAEPAITKDAAIKTVEQEAVKIYPASTASLKILSADLRWKDFHNPDKVTPAPGSIPLAWKVQFEDETIRGWQWPVPANGWVDAKTGTLLDLYYRH